MIPVASTPHPASIRTPKPELQVWSRELPGGTKGSPRRSWGCPVAPCPVLPPRRAVGGGRVQLLRLPASSSPCANTRGLGKYLSSHSPGRLIVREHGRGHRGSSCARGELGVSVGAQGAHSAHGWGQQPTTMGGCNFWLPIVAVERVQIFLCCPGDGGSAQS